MSEKTVRFSRLLRIFELNGEPAYIIELKEDNQKILYISYMSHFEFRSFERYNDNNNFKYNIINFKNEFNNLPNHCLMSSCTDASYMFFRSPITHFEADCSNIVNGESMFSNSDLCFINTEFSLLECAEYMFSNTKIKEMTINFPKLKIGDNMFYKSPLEKITSQFPMLESAEFMLSYTQLKKINCQFPILKNKDRMFEGTSSKLKQNNPYYFV